MALHDRFLLLLAPRLESNVRRLRFGASAARALVFGTWPGLRVHERSTLVKSTTAAQVAKARRLRPYASRVQVFEAHGQAECRLDRGDLGYPRVA